jgi:hypothetical protein
LERPLQSEVATRHHGAPNEERTMKKASKKLSLSKQTVRALQVKELEVAVGGCFRTLAPVSCEIKCVLE